MSDVAYLNATWDLVNSFWEIVDLEQRMNGVTPRRLTRFLWMLLPVSCMVDISLSFMILKMTSLVSGEDLEAIVKGKRSVTSAYTKHGHTKARNANGLGPIRVSLDVLPRHFDMVVHDLAYREVVSDVNSHLRHSDASRHGGALRR